MIDSIFLIERSWRISFSSSNAFAFPFISNEIDSFLPFSKFRIIVLTAGGRLQKEEEKEKFKRGRRMHYVRRKVDAAWCWKGERNERARKNSGKRGRRGGNERGGRRIIRIARSRYADSRRERSYFAGRFRGMGKREEKQVWRRCGWKTRGEPGTGRDRLVFSIYSRGEKLNRIRCRIRVSIFHKIGGKAEYRGSFVSKNTLGSIFSTVTRYFSKNFVRDPRSPGKTRKNYDTHEPAGRVSFREFVNSASKIGMESLISYPVNVSPIGEIVAI